MGRDGSEVSFSMGVLAVVAFVLFLVAAVLSVLVFDLHRQNFRLKADLESVRAELVSLQKEVNSCSSDLSACKLQRDSLSDQLFLLQYDYNSLRERYDSLRQDYADVVRLFFMRYAVVSLELSAFGSYMSDDCMTAIYYANKGLDLLDRYDSFVQDHADLVRRVVSSDVYKEMVAKIGGDYDFGSIYSYYLDTSDDRNFFNTVIAGCLGVEYG